MTRTVFVPLLLDATGAKVWKGSAEATEAAARKTAAARNALLGNKFEPSAQPKTEDDFTTTTKAATSSSPSPVPVDNSPAAVERREKLKKRVEIYRNVPTSIRETCSYPERDGRIELRVPNDGRRNSGGLIGYVYPSRAFLKIIQPHHLRRNPPAIAYDEKVLEAYRSQIDILAVYVRDRKDWYVVDIDTFRLHAIRLADRGFSGSQLALPLPYWKIHVSLL